VKIVAALLAGGESRRMGRDKALIMFAGEPLWRRQVDLLRKLNPSEVFVSARNDPPWRPRDIHFVGDAEPSRGALSGVAACLARSQSEHMLVLAVDMPFMTEASLRRICRGIAPSLGVFPMVNGRAEPLAAVYLRKSLPEFLSALTSDDFSLQTLVRKLIAAGTLQPLAVEPKDVASFRSVNEPGDLLSLPSDGA